jgi:glyoxalase superfamily protein
MTAEVQLVGATLDCVDPRSLARFYRQLLGWTDIVEENDDWVSVREPGGTMHVSCQREPRYRRPVWPSQDDAPQMMLHLEFRVADLNAACALAESLGATRMPWQPQPDVRVYADPEGHPFCLFSK